MYTVKLNRTLSTVESVSSHSRTCHVCSKIIHYTRAISRPTKILRDNSSCGFFSLFVCLFR